MSEKLELVTDFATLRAGMIVVTKGCKCCGKQLCRSMLTVKRPSGAWASLPNCNLIGKVSVISKETVATKCVYRVVDDIEQTTESRKAVTT